MTGDSDARSVARTFLTQIGYLSGSGEGEIAFRMFYDCFLVNGERPWTVEALEADLGTSRPTVYRHLNKLKAFDLLEETGAEDPTTRAPRKAYRLRYGNLAKAWNFVEAHVRVAVENYARTVEHLADLLDDGGARRTRIERAAAPVAGGES